MTKQEQILARVQEVLQKAVSIYGASNLRVKFYLGGDVETRFDIGGYRAAGMAGCRKGTGDPYLRFHPVAVEKYFDTMMNEVIPHEIAHLVCYAAPMLGRRHDLGWKMVCRALGGTGERLHTMDLGRPTPEVRIARRLARQPYVYIDSKGVARRLSTRIHNRIQLKGARYRYRDNGASIGKMNPFKYSPAVVDMVAQKVVPKAPPVAPPADLGGLSKADVCRALIKANYGQMTEAELIKLIAAKAGLSNGLAKKYYSNNLGKAFQA